jgi:hypothetical protein
MGPLRFYMAFHPDDVKHVMQENNQNYVKGALIARAADHQHPRRAARRRRALPPAPRHRR